MSAIEPGAQLMVGINARIADGTDTSWLYDVPFERLDGRVRKWVTLNEPIVFLLGGYLGGLIPPGQRRFAQRGPPPLPNRSPLSNALSAPLEKNP